MKKWNVAIIGLGFVGKLHYDALRRLPNVHVRTIVVHKAQDIPLVKENYDADVVTDCWQEAVADPQIQVIHNCTPNALHDEINLAAIGAGKHLYAEKPMSLTTAGAEEVLAAAKAAGIAHAINYQCRMNGAVLEMRARLQRGQAGRPLYVGGQYLQESVARKPGNGAGDRGAQRRHHLRHGGVCRRHPRQRPVLQMYAGTQERPAGFRQRG